MPVLVSDEEDEAFHVGHAASCMAAGGGVPSFHGEATLRLEAI